MEPSEESAPIRSSLLAFLEASKLIEVVPPDVLAVGLTEIEAELLVLGAQTLAAGVRGVRFADAVRDFESYPALAKLHASLEDILTRSLPRELEVWARRFVSEPPSTAIETVNAGLVRAAHNDPVPVRRWLARLFLFEGIRLQLLLRMRWFPYETYRAGMEDQDADEIAEREMERWLSTPALLSELSTVRPLHVIAAAAIEEFTHQAELLSFALRTVGQEVHEALEQRAKFEATLSHLDSRDAILTRNEFAVDFDVQPLTIDLLRERHPVAFGDVTRNALDQRARDNRRKLARKGPAILRRRGIALLDLVSEGMAPEHRLPGWEYEK